MEDYKTAGTTQGSILGATRERSEEGQGDSELHRSKKILIPVPTLADCLGEENLRKLIEEENLVRRGGSNVYEWQDGNFISQGSSESLIIVTEGNLAREEGQNTDKEGEEDELEATGPGAADKLSGADDGAWQEQ